MCKKNPSTQFMFLNYQRKVSQLFPSRMLCENSFKDQKYVS